MPLCTTRLPATPHVALALLLLARPTGLTAQAAGGEAATGTLSGMVLTDVGEKPIANAEVRLSGSTRAVRSDSAGRFELSGLPTGMQRFEVRAIGFQPLRQSLVIPAGRSMDVDLLLVAEVQQLSTVRVGAEAGVGVRRPWLSGFEERRSYGIGSFLTEAELEKQDPSRWASAVAQHVPGLQLVSYNGRASFGINRGLISFNNMPRGDRMDQSQGAPRSCYVQVIIDDVVRYASRVDEPLFDVSSIDPGTVAAVEFYSVSQLPARFNRGGNAPCGTLVIWRK